MIHNDVLNQLQFLIKTSVPPLVEVAQTPLAEPQWVPGQRLTAVVLANQPSGRFQVQIGDQILDMNLPRNTQAGDQVELTYVANQPRLTFVLTRDLAAAAEAHAAAQPTAQVTVSDSARSLGDLLHRLADASPGKTKEAVQSQPLLPSSPGDIKQFATTLRNALSQSGLFYESHQAQWVAGERKLTDLLQEPQGKLSSPALSPQAAPMEGGQNKSITLSTPVAEALGAQNPLRLPVHAEVVSLVQQQLQTLDTRQFLWQGTVWQGQSMEWRVEERQPREGGTGEEEKPHWQTSLRLQLPSLGDVQATLAFMPEGGLRINIQAEAGTAERMSGAQGQLLRSMEASGLRILEMSVLPHEKT